MKKKLLISVLLCITIFCSACGIENSNPGDYTCKHSYDNENDKVCNLCGFLNSERPSFVVSEAKAGLGKEKVAVTVSVKNNPGIASIILSLTYDNAAIKLSEIEYNTDIGGQTVYPQELDSPVALYWINGLANTTGDWILATLYFDVSEAEIGEYDIMLDYDANNVYNISEENLDFEVIHGKIVIE